MTRPAPEFGGSPARGVIGPAEVARRSSEVLNLNRPLVSVVIPTYQRAHTLGRAIDSALAQTYSPLEVVVSDNASSDGTADLLRRYADESRLTVVAHDRNLGPLANWSAGVAASRGQLTKINYSDDWLEPHTVESMADALIENPSAGFAIIRQAIHINNAVHHSIPMPGEIRLDELVQAMSIGFHSLPVSPGAALLYRDDVVWGLELASRALSSPCIERAVGPDLLILYGAFRRASYGMALAEGGVHFEGGEDSITMLEDFSFRRRCYLSALDVLLSEIDAPDERALLRQLTWIRQAAESLSGRQETVGRFSMERLPLSTHMRAVRRTSSTTAEMLSRKVAATLKGTVGRPRQ